MNFNEAMQMLGTKLQGKYGHLGFKYKKSDKTLTRHSKNFTYMIAFSSFGGNTKDNLANRFVGELMEQLVQDGLLVTTKTRNGPGVRTATDAEISSPLPGQQQMTL